VEKEYENEWKCANNMLFFKKRLVFRAAKTIVWTVNEELTVIRITVAASHTVPAATVSASKLVSVTELV
jgi:hypothetical protein